MGNIGYGIVGAVTLVLALVVFLGLMFVVGTVVFVLSEGDLPWGYKSKIKGTIAYTMFLGVSTSFVLAVWGALLQPIAPLIGHALIDLGRWAMKG